MDDGEKLFTKTSIPIRCGPSTALHGGGNTGAQYADNSRLAHVKTRALNEGPHEGSVRNHGEGP